MYTLDLEVHALPKALNRSLNAHYMKRYKTNLGWDWTIAALCLGQVPEKPLTRARIKIVRHFYRMLDYDGLVGSMKPVVDALVTAGVLESDSWNVLHIWDVDQKFRSKKDGPLLEISVMEV